MSESLLKAELEKRLEKAEKSIADEQSEIDYYDSVSKPHRTRLDAAVQLKGEIENALAVLFQPTPRQWASIDEVPKDVAVHGPTGIYWSYWDENRRGEFGQILSYSGQWLWSYEKSKSPAKFQGVKAGGPFIEVLEDAK